MAKDKQINRPEEGGENASDSKGQTNEKSTASGEGSSTKRGNEKKEPQTIDLTKLRKTTTSQIPKASTIAGTTRTKVVAPTAPPMDWKFSIFACVGCMFFALLTHIFGINVGLVLNDRYNLAYLMSQPLRERVSESILVDMLGVSPLSQPWLKASFISDQGEYGMNFSWYHSVNVFWHALTTGMIFFFVLTVARHLRHQKRLNVVPHHLAAATAILFACHPLTGEAVTYLSARSALLGTNNFFFSLCFCLMGMLVRHTLWRIVFVIAAMFTGAMSLLSSPETVALPTVALFTLYFIKRPLSNWKETVAEHPFLTGIGAALAIAAPCLWFLGVQYCTAMNLMVPRLAPAAYFASQLKGLVFYYLPAFFVPAGISIDPPFAVANGFTDPLVIAAIVIIVAIAGLLFSKLKHPIVGFASVLTLAGLLPHMLMVQPDAVADWVTYLPLTGVMVFVAYGIATVANQNFTRACFILGTVSTLFCGYSIYRDMRWASNYSLWESALMLRPKSALAHAMIAIEYLKRQQYEDAEKEAKLAVKLKPDLVMARIAEAKVELHNKNWQKADEIFKSAESLAETQKLPPAAKAECRLGQLECLIAANREKESNGLLTKLIQEMPGDPKLYYVVAQSALQNHDYEKAFKMLNEAVNSDPSLVECWEPMAECAFALRANDQAYVAAQNYLSSVDGTNAKLLLARAALVTKRENEAEEILKGILQSEKKNARAMYLLSRLYKRWDKKDEWKKYRDDAIKADPDVTVNYAVPELDMDDALNAASENKDAAGAPPETPPAQNQPVQAPPSQAPAPQTPATQTPASSTSPTPAAGESKSTAPASTDAQKPAEPKAQPAASKEEPKPATPKN